MKNDKLKLFWGYLKEIIVVCLIYGVALWKIDAEKLVAFMIDHWAVFSTIAGVLYAGGIASLSNIAQQFDSDFGVFLNWRKADKPFLLSYQVQSVLFLIACILPIASALSASQIVAHVSWCAFFAACVNGVSLIQNTVSLIMLKLNFNIKKSEEQNKLDKKNP